MSRFPIGATVTVDALSVDPYPLFERLRTSEPVTWAPSLGQWLITSRELGMEVLRDHERFRTDNDDSPIRDTFGAQMLSTEGEVQRRYKSACAPPFNARAAVESRTMVAHIADRAIDRLRHAPDAELRSTFAARIALETIARVIGLPEELDDQLRRWYDVFADALMNYARDVSTRTRAHAAARAFRDAIAPKLAMPDESERSLLATLASAHPRLLDDTEIGELVDAVRTTSNDPDLDLLLVRFHLETGARRQGALNLELRDLDVRRATVWLREKNDHQREQPVSPSLVALLGRAAGRHLHALAHNRDPRPVQVGRRRRSIG